MKKVVEILKKHNEIRIINESLDVDLEIPHVAYLEVKRQDSKALLFTNPVSKRLDRSYSMPVLMNLFGSFSRLNLLLGNVEELAGEIEFFLSLPSNKAKGFKERLRVLKRLIVLRLLKPKLISSLPRTEIFKDEEVDLYSLPILKTWDEDAAGFITMPQVYTRNLEGNIKNLGMYRLQVYSRNELGMHWQVHKDSAHFFNEYKKAGKNMPISIAIGGDPLYTYLATAPFPHGIYELMVYPLFKKKRLNLNKSLHSDLCVPSDVDILIEGSLDPNDIRLEGPFGDHTGYYTLKEPYPCLKVHSISMKKDAIFLATVVAKPPLEDKYLGYASERIFLPAIRMINFGLLDYHMPENGVFHNLMLVKISAKFKGHFKQIMHNFFGSGQLSFIKHLIIVDEEAPPLTNYEAISHYILDNFDFSNLLLSEGIADALDHAGEEFALSGKLCAFIESGEKEERNKIYLNDADLLNKIKLNYKDAINLRQYFINTNTPITILSINKTSRVLDAIFPKEHINILIVVDDNDNDLDNLYMLVWRVVNNIDTNRDVILEKDFLLIDATKKGSLEGFMREWPNDVNCNINVLERLKERNIINYDDGFLRKFHIDKAYKTK